MKPIKILCQLWLIASLCYSCKKETSLPKPPASPPTEDPQIKTLRTVAAWDTLFKNAWTNEYNTAGPQSRSNDSWQYYNLAYSIDANTCMFQATGNTSYLDRALYYINNVINSARLSSAIPTSQFKDSFMTWVNHSAPSLGNDGLEYPLYESFCWRYVTTLLRVLKNSPTILANETYNSQYNYILAFSERNIFQKWYSRGANSYVYRSNTHMASHWARISMDLWCITGKDLYHQVFDNFNHHLPNYASSMRNQIKSHPRDPNAYWWNQDWGQFSAPGQDIAHGNAVIAMMVEAHDACLEYTDNDINALLRTFKILWSATTATVFPEYVDGTGTNGGWYNDGFLKLGRYDIPIQKNIEAYTRAQNTQLYGNGALNACILINKKPVYPTVTCK